MVSYTMAATRWRVSFRGREGGSGGLSFLSFSILTKRSTHHVDEVGVEEFPGLCGWGA
jgi:hypothetical protein